MKLPQQKQTFRQKLGIRAVVVVSFVVPIVTAVSLTGWFSIRNGQKAVNNLVNQLSSELTNRIENRIQTFAETPYQFLQINLAAIRAGNLDLDNLNGMAEYFWHQISITEAVPYVYFGNEQGDFIGVWKESESLTTLRIRDQTSAPDRRIYELDEQGDRGEITKVHEYDPRVRPWYQEAVEARRPTWSSVYVFAEPPSLGITHVVPVYDVDADLQGVMAIDLTLADISDFLQGVDVGESGEVFIFERSGEIIASSSEEAPFIETEAEEQRLAITDSSNALIRAAAENLDNRFDGFEQIENPEQFIFEIDGERHFLQVTPIQNDRNLDWIMAVAIPEQDFMAQINANTRTTVLLCLLALAAATIAGILTSRLITVPVQRLGQAATAIASGDLDQTVETEGVGELSVLGNSFNQMAQQLRTSFAALETANAELEERVANRTATLNQESQTLQQDVSHLLDVVSAVEEGDLTIEAEVSPQVTGLVADTFNRLIERLDQTMGTVLNGAGQVTQGAQKLEQLALSVADNTQQQAQSVGQVQGLMENISNLSQDAAQQAATADEAFQLTQASVQTGQQEITAMTAGLGTLQQETTQIIKRTQTLTDYVELAAQFAKEQKRIASQTRVLALNASMLATRSAEQQDPEQFASITREFETIATQVNDLATQTNQSLISLQQRTDQIQTVVSGLNYDIQRIDQQVNDFTSGVTHSREAFDHIKTATDQVGQIGQRVTQSSQAIAEAAQTTLQAVQDIAAIAGETSTRANMTQEQSEQMEQLAQVLLQKVQFFHLRPDPDSVPAIIGTSTAHVLPSAAAEPTATDDAPLVETRTEVILSDELGSRASETAKS